MTRIYAGYWDRTLMKFVEGPPPPREVFGRAPMVKFGSLTPQPHPVTGEVIDNVRRWDQVDAENGCVTTGSRPATPVKSKEREIQRRKDIDQAVERAVNDLEWGAAPLAEASRAHEKQMQEQVKSLTGVDLADVK